MAKKKTAKKPSKRRLVSKRELTAMKTCFEAKDMNTAEVARKFKRQYRHVRVLAEKYRWKITKRKYTKAKGKKSGKRK